MKGIYKNQESNQVVKIFIPEERKNMGYDGWAHIGEDKIGNTYHICYCKWIMANWERIFE